MLSGSLCDMKVSIKIIHRMYFICGKLCCVKNESDWYVNMFVQENNEGRFFRTLIDTHFSKNIGLSVMEHDFYFRFKHICFNTVDNLLYVK